MYKFKGMKKQSMDDIIDKLPLLQLYLTVDCNVG